MYGPSSYSLYIGGGSNAASAGVKFQVGSGPVNETLLCFLMHTNDGSYTIANIAFCHDILGAGVAFTAGNIINVLYTFAFKIVGIVSAFVMRSRFF